MQPARIRQFGDRKVLNPVPERISLRKLLPKSLSEEAVQIECIWQETDV